MAACSAFLVVMAAIGGLSSWAADAPSGCNPVRPSPKLKKASEAFVKTIKRDYVWFGDLKDAEAVMKQLPGWIEDYNENAPHKALKMLSPRGFIKLQKLAG